MVSAAPNIIPSKRAEPSKFNEKRLGKKVEFFPLTEKKKLKNIYFFSSYVLKMSAFFLVLHTHEITDIFNTFDEINLVFTSKK